MAYLYGFDLNFLTTDKTYIWDDKFLVGAGVGLISPNKITYYIIYSIYL